VTLLANTLATVGGLYILIEVFGPISGAHFNPAVSAVMAYAPRAAGGDACCPTSAAQLARRGGSAPGWPTRCSSMPLLQFSAKLRSGTWAVDRRSRGHRRPAAGHPARAGGPRCRPWSPAYIGAAYWFTASTSFANPAAAFGRMFSDSFAGIAPSSAPGFVLAELIGALIGLAVHNAFEPRLHPAGHPNVIESSGQPQDQNH
jgi:hypothetical protein